MSILNRKIKWILLHGAFIIGTAPEVLCFEVGLAAEATMPSDSLLVNARYVSVKNGGVGVILSHATANGYLDFSIATLVAKQGDASATFSGASVAGPANLSMNTWSAKAYALPQSNWTPLVAYAEMSRAGNLDFSGSKNSSLVSGTAQINYDHNAWQLGGRVMVNPRWALELGMGQYSWKIKSDAVGYVGKVKTWTTIESSGIDPFQTLSVRFQADRWVYTAEYGLYQMKADNTVNTQTAKATVRYVF